MTGPLGYHGRGVRLVAFDELEPALVTFADRCVAQSVILTAECVHAPERKILLVQLAIGVSGQRNQRSGKAADAIAGGLKMTVEATLHVEPRRRVADTVGTFDVFARVVVDLELAVLELCVAGLVGCEIGGGFLEIIVLQRDLAGGEAPLGDQAVERFLLGGTIGRAGRKAAAAAVDGLEGRGLVGEDQLVSAFRMLEVVADAMLLHQPANERHVGLSILNAVLELRIIPRQIVLEVREVVLAEDFLDDLRRSLLMKDQAVMPK